MMTERKRKSFLISTAIFLLIIAAIIGLAAAKHPRKIDRRLSAEQLAGTYTAIGGGWLANDCYLLGGTIRLQQSGKFTFEADVTHRISRISSQSVHRQFFGFYRICDDGTQIEMRCDSDLEEIEVTFLAVIGEGVLTVESIPFYKIKDE